MVRSIRLLAVCGGVLASGALAWAFQAGQPGIEAAPGVKIPEADAHGDKLPGGVSINRLGTVRFHHGSRILAVAYSPDGKWIAAGGGDDPVRLWEAQTGKEIRTFNEPWVAALAFSPDGTRLATGGFFKRVKIWDVNTGKELAASPGPDNPKDAHQATIKALAFKADGSQVVSGSQDKSVRVWNANTCQLIATHAGHEDEVSAIAISPDGKLIASAGGDRTIRLWGAMGDPILKAPSSLYSLAFADDNTLVSGGDDNVIRIWDLGAKKESKQLKGHTGTVVGLALATKTLVSLGQDATVRRWDLAGGKDKAITCNAGDTDALAVSPDGKQVAIAGLNKVVRRFDVASGKEQIAAPGPLSGVTSTSVSPDGKRIAAGDGAGTIHLWDAEAGTKIRAWDSKGKKDVCVLFLPDGKTLASINVEESPSIRFWNVDNGTQTRELKANAPPGLPRSLAVSPDGKLLAVCEGSELVRVWDLANSKEITTLASAGGAMSAAFSRDSKLLAVGGFQHLALHETDKWAKPRLLNKAPRASALAFSPDNHTLAAGLADGPIQLYDLQDPKSEPRSLDGHTSSVYGVAFSPSGRVLISGSADKTVRLWETALGQTFKTCNGHIGNISGVSFGPHGRRGISSSEDATLLIWDVTGRSPDGKISPFTMPADPTPLWDDLATKDAPKAHRTLWAMIGSGDKAVEILSNRVFLADPKKIDQFVKDLDDNKFSIREKAMSSLKAYGLWIEGVLVKALKNPPSDEARRRLEKLLQELRVPGAITLEQEQLRARRIMDILEQLGTPPAQTLLEKIAREGAEADIREEAQQALRRLGKK